MREGYLIGTTLGDALLSSSDHVYVKVSPTGYVKKRSSDVNVGDMVIYRKPYTATHLEDVEPHLTKSPRYTAAKDLIHERNERGDYVPKLRVLLLEGLAEHGVIDPENVRERALYEMDDFSEEEYRDMTLHVAQELDRRSITLRPETIRSWLEGDTLAPQDWQAFRVLERGVNPAFGEFRGYDDDPQGMYFNYRMYVTLRRGIMRMLNHFRGTSVGGPEVENQRDSRISLSPEFAIVAQHFMTNETEQYATGRVTRTERLVRKRIEKERDTNLRLVDGIEIEEVPGFEGSLKGYQDIFEENEILEQYLEAVIEDYLFEGGLLLDDVEVLPRQYLHALRQQTLYSIYQRFGDPLDDMMLRVQENRLRMEKDENGRRLLDYVNQIIDALLMGEIDTAIGTDRGRVLYLTEVQHQVRTALPKIFFRYMGQKKRRPSLKPKLQRLGFRFGLTDTLAPGFFLSSGLEELHEDRPGEYGFRRRLIDGDVSDTLIERFVETLEKWDATNMLITSERTRQTLGEYRLDDLFFLRESDFVWEGFV